MSEHIALSATEKNKLLKSFNKVARWTYSEKKTNITPDDLDNKHVQQLVNDINDVLKDALQSGIKYEIPEAMLQHFKQNVYVFSGCKTYAELRELSNLLIDEKGEIKSFSKFFKDVRQVHNEYNKTYLESEYLFATQSAQMASKWVDFEQDGDEYNLQYRTANDNKVRYSHQLLHNTTLPASDPFWNKFFPPNGWRCRCNTVQVRKNRYPESDSTTADDLGNKATYTIGAGGKNTSAMFRFNPGKEKIIFPETHPYFNNKEVVIKLSEPNNGKINLKEYIKGDIATNAEAKNILQKYAEIVPEDFRQGLENVSFRSSKNYFMQHVMKYKPHTGEWVGSSSISISTHNFILKIGDKLDTINFADELKSALGAIKKGEKLTFKQEYSIESLWHEILHAKTKTKAFGLSAIKVQEMETINQFVARHTYDGFLSSLGGKAQHKNTILENGLGYSRHVSDFRKLLKDNGIDENKAVEILQPKLLNNYSTIGEEVINFIEKNKKK